MLTTGPTPPGPPAGPAPGSSDADPFTGRVTAWALVGLLILGALYLAVTLLFPSRTEGYLRDLVALQQLVVLAQSELAEDLSDIRQRQGLPPARRLALSRIKKLRAQLERQLGPWVQAARNGGGLM